MARAALAGERRGHDAYAMPLAQKNRIFAEAKDMLSKVKRQSATAKAAAAATCEQVRL